MSDQFCTLEYRLDTLEAEVAELRTQARAERLTLAYSWEDGYRTGRESILGTVSEPSARTPQAERWLHAVPPPAADAEAELEAGA